MPGLIVPFYETVTETAYAPNADHGGASSPTDRGASAVVADTQPSSTPTDRIADVSPNDIASSAALTDSRGSTEG